MLKMVGFLVSFTLFFSIFTSSVWAQTPIYTVEVGHQDLWMPVSLPNEGFEVNALLKADNEVVLDQSEITYEWEVADPEIVELDSFGFTSGCPYDVMAPCPNLHASLHGLKPGTTQIHVIVKLHGEVITETTVPATVGLNTYHLGMTDEVITLPLNTGYGINALFQESGTLILDQSTISYVWQVDDPEVVRIESSGFESGCPYDVLAPCPNLHADLFALKEGQTTVEVQAFIGDVAVASASAQVIVRTEAVVACLLADINQDSVVNLLDYSALVNNFLADGPVLARADINQDGNINIIDYTLLAGHFMESCEEL